MEAKIAVLNAMCRVAQDMKVDPVFLLRLDCAFAGQVRRKYYDVTARLPRCTILLK